jgi:hypothetical protein
MADSKPNSDRRVEGDEGAGAQQEERSGSLQAGEIQKHKKTVPEKNRPKPNDGNKHKRSAPRNDQAQSSIESHLTPGSAEGERDRDEQSR